MNLFPHLSLAIVLLTCSCVSVEDAQAWDSDESSESGESGESDDEMRAFPGPNEPNPYWCHDVCSLYSSCNKACDAYVVGLTTCGDFGVCNDLDDDGHLYPSDTCPNTPGPNTDCDDDDIGDVCDPLDATLTTTTTYDSHSQEGPSYHYQCTCSGVRYQSWYVCQDEYLETEAAYCAGPKAGTSEVVSAELQDSNCAFECFVPDGPCALNSPGCVNFVPFTC